jgi:hypothetical protein
VRAASSWSVDFTYLTTLLLVATRGAGAACGRFGFALNIAATFDVFSGLQVSNYGLFYVLFESAPNGSNHIDVWLFWIRAQTVSPDLFRGNLLPTSPGESKLKSCLPV